MAEVDQQRLMQYLQEVEETAEDMLADRQQIVDLDRKRQKTREAIRALYKNKTTQKQWVCCGNMFIKMPKEQTKKMLDKDFEKLDDEINSNRNKLKVKMDTLRDLEKSDELKGFHLKPLSKEETRALQSIL